MMMTRYDPGLYKAFLAVTAPHSYVVTNERCSGMYAHTSALSLVYRHGNVRQSAIFIRTFGLNSCRKILHIDIHDPPEVEPSQALFFLGNLLMLG